MHRYIVTVNMKYSAVVLLALFGLCAASVLHDDVSDDSLSEHMNQRNGWNTVEDKNNVEDLNKEQYPEENTSYRHKIWNDDDDWNTNTRNNRNNNRNCNRNNNNCNNRNNNNDNDWNRKHRNNDNDWNNNGNDWDNENNFNDVDDLDNDFRRNSRNNKNKHNRHHRHHNNNNNDNNNNGNNNDWNDDNDWNKKHDNEFNTDNSENKGFFNFLSYMNPKNIWNNDDNLNNRRNRNGINNNQDDVININQNKNSLKDKQKTVLLLLNNLMQKNTDSHLVTLGKQFNPIENLDRFNNKQAVIKFLKNVENNDILSRHEVFCPTNQVHQNQAAQLFTLLYSARDWTTLKQAAAWARNIVNADKFAYVLTAVILNHPTTQGVVVPALYELIPHAFIPATTLQEITKAKLLGVKQLTVRATYNNENRNNVNYNTKGITNNDDLNVRNSNKNIGTHNPNNVFADNDGSLINKAGILENIENRLSYFTEDVGINDLHARFHIQHPVFLGVNNHKNYFTSNMDNTNDVNLRTDKLDVKRGENFYFTHQQLLARYVLERLSNNLPLPLTINLDDKIETGYNPNLRYTNGKAFPARPANINIPLKKLENNNNNNDLVPNNNQAETPKTYEQRLLQVAESGMVLNKDGSKTKLNKRNAIGVLANLIAAPASSLNPDYYGDYFSTAKNVIGNIIDPNNQNGVAPGVVSNYLTAARDPAYYQLLTKINKIFKALQNKLGPYTQSQLHFPGVKIEKIDVSDLVTYLDTTIVNVNNAVLTNKGNNGIDIDNGNRRNVNNMDDGDYNVKVQRLTNKPFNIKLTVMSNKNTDAIVRIFLGPKFDSNGQLFTLAQASQYFVQLDQMKVRLTTGKNIINKNSIETNVNVQNPVTLKQLWNRVEQGQNLNINKGDHQVLGLPLRTQLPKGKVNGQDFILYAIINDINDRTNGDENINGDLTNEMTINNENGMHTIDTDLNNSDDLIMNNNNNNDDGNNNLNNKIVRRVRDNRSVGFPLDRPVVNVNHNTANQYFKTVTIYHKINKNNNNINN